MSSTAPSSSSSSTSASTSLSPPPSSSSSSGTCRRACAACNQRRKGCPPDCVFAPFFPVDQRERFSNAHKHFGYANIKNIISPLDPVQRNYAMRSIIYESDARARDPVGGCYRIVEELERQLAISSAELNDVLGHLAIFRAQASAPAAPSHAMTAITDPDLLPSTSCPIYGGPDHDSLPYLDHPDTISVDDHIIGRDCEICVMEPADAPPPPPPPPPPDASHLDLDLDLRIGLGLSNVDDDNKESSKG